MNTSRYVGRILQKAAAPYTLAHLKPSGSETIPPLPRDPFRRFAPHLNVFHDVRQVTAPTHADGKTELHSSFCIGLPEEVRLGRERHQLTRIEVLRWTGSHR